MENVSKVAYLCAEYPDKNIREIAAMFNLPKITVNVAIWRAQGLGLITVNEETDEVTVSQETLDGRLDWDFGEGVDRLQSDVKYLFGHMAEMEEDVHEEYLGSAMAGYTLQDQMIGVSLLVNEGYLKTYILEADEKSEYLFYCLAENHGKNWGLKQYQRQQEVITEQQKAEKDEGAKA